MIWRIFWWLSLAALAGTVVLVITTAKRKNGKIKPLFILFGGVFVSSSLLIFPIYSVSFEGDIAATVKAILISLQNTIQFFTADSDFALITDNIVGMSGWMKNAYSLLGAILIIFSPLLTFGFVLSFFKEATSQLRHILHMPADTYVFSEINTKSVSLAESIRKTNKKAILIFTNIPKDEESVDDDLLSRAGYIDGILYKKDISLIRIPWIKAGREISFFALCENESESISDTLQLIQNYKSKDNVKIYLFSSNVESELMLNNIDKGLLRVRRVNPINSLVNHILIQDGKLLFDGATKLPNGKNEISVLILGVGVLGKELLKSLTWYCQMDNHTLRINAVDIQSDIKDQVRALCPELIDEKYNGQFKEGEAFYNVEVHSCNVKTETFKNVVRAIGSVSCVFVSLGDDSLNVEAAVNMRTLFEQMRIHPQIFAFVSDTDKRIALHGAKDKNGVEYDIRFVGDARTVFSADVIINSETEREALELHKKYNNGDPYGFYEFEYNYKSSMASVIHLAAREHCKIPGAGKAESELTEFERQTIETLEHKRWNAYMRSEGFIYSGSKSKESRNDMGKMHHNLVVYDDLTDEDKRKDSRVGAK